MTRLALGLILGLAALPALAEDMTEAEREALRAEIRAYLLENPEVLVEAMSVLQEREDIAALERDKMLVVSQSDALFVNENDWVGGNPDGDVTVVEFMDYRCGYCRKAYDEVEALVNTDGNIRFVVKEFPILGDASLLIIHECQDLRITPAGVQQILDALASLSGALEHWAGTSPAA